MHRLVRGIWRRMALVSLAAVTMLAPGRDAVAQCIGTPPGIVSWWRAEGDALDQVGGHHGTEMGTVTYVAGRVGSAFEFDGSSWIDVPDSSQFTLGSSPFTIELWARFAHLQGRDPFIGHDDGGGGQRKWIFWFDESGHRGPGGPALRFHINGPSLGALDPVVALWAAVTNRWYHVAITRNGATYTLYIDGIAVITETDSHVVPDPTVPLTIGRAEGYLFDGAIDEVTLYDRALSAAEIGDIVAAGAAGKCATCGNGLLDPTEQCDDANAINGDGCDINCTTTACGNGIGTAGEACDDGNVVSGDGCRSNCQIEQCGDGVTDAPREQCDDGNVDEGDGCDTNCTTTACGNGIVTAGETCDDGNLVSGDGCRSNCLVEVCGDGVRDVPAEQCDDGNGTSGDGCDTNCTTTACGNGIVTAGETCDDGNFGNGDGCRADCSLEVCGDGRFDPPGEQCDDGNVVDGDGCDSTCTRTVCGNGVTTVGEACDDGNFVNGDGCDANCTATGCGNHLLTAGEECDDGNTTGGDGCESDCLRSCGNGSVDGSPLEACDDGNRTSGDGCDANCTPTGCGNGVVTSGEECDDGDLLSGDSCDAVCHVVCLPTLPGLVAWWPGNGNALEAVGGRNGTPVGAVTHVPGKVGAAFHFDADSLVEIADDPVWTLGSHDFSIDLWVNFDRLQGRDPFIGHDENGGELNKWIFWYDASGHRAPGGPALRFHINSPTLGPLDPVVYPWSPAVGRWYHVAVTRSGTTYALYIDGVQVITEEDAHVLPDPLVPLTIGKAEAYLFDGSLDEVEIYDRALTPGEVQDIFAAGAIGKCSLCGNQMVDPNEQCDDGNAIVGDGCEPTCLFTPEEVSATAGLGEVVTTDSEADGATPTDAVETAVTAPGGGSVTIKENPGDGTGAFGFLTQRIDITAPAASVEVPLVIVFRIDASQIPSGTDLATIGIFKDGAAVPDCTVADATASPDPCVASRALAGDDDVELTVLTSTASFWNFGVCGNGKVEGGEQCDDPAAQGNGCQDCRIDFSRLIPGGGRGPDCALEWLVSGSARRGRGGIPREIVECRRGDAGCDFEPDDDACTFRVALCLNATDPRVGCQGSNVRFVRIGRPSLDSDDPSDTSNRGALGDAAARLGGLVGGVCANKAALGRSCALNGACDSRPGRNDGRCRRFVFFDPAQSVAQQCTEFAPIRVPLARGGTRKLQLEVGPYGSPVIGRVDGGDTDMVRLKCKDH